MAAASKGWIKEGNPPPLIFSPEQLSSSCDVSPIELLDMKEFHKVLLGEDPLASLKIDPKGLRLAVEREFRGKLLHLRGSYLLASGDKKALAGLMTGSLSPLLVLCRAALRLHTDKVPASKLDCAAQLRKHVEFDAEIFQLAHALKKGEYRPGADVETLFGRYLSSIERLCAAADKWTGNGN